MKEGSKDERRFLMKELTKIRPIHGHCFPSEPMPLETWKNSGTPYEWFEVERRCVNGETYVVYVDNAYGEIMLAKASTRKYLYLVGVSCGYHIITSDVVCLDKNFYNTDKYLWF